MGIKWVSKKKKKSLTKTLVPFVIFSIFTFTGIAIFIQYRTGMELSSTLIMCFYGFCTGELWCLSSIKKMKIKHSSGYKVLEENVENEEEGVKG